METWYCSGTDREGKDKIFFKKEWESKKGDCLRSWDKCPLQTTLRYLGIYELRWMGTFFNNS